MADFAIIEVPEGLAVAELEPGLPAEMIAIRQGGLVIDPGPYHRYEDAYDAMLSLRDEEDELGTE
jgi:hypothetical protein